MKALLHLPLAAQGLQSPQAQYSLHKILNKKIWCALKSSKGFRICGCLDLLRFAMLAFVSLAMRRNTLVGLVCQFCFEWLIRRGKHKKALEWPTAAKTDHHWNFPHRREGREALLSYLEQQRTDGNVSCAPIRSPNSIPKRY